MVYKDGTFEDFKHPSPTSIVIVPEKDYDTKMLRFILLAAVAFCITEASQHYGRAAPHK